MAELLTSIEPAMLWLLQIIVQMALLFLLALAFHVVSIRKPKMQYFNWLAVTVVLGVLVPMQFLVPPWTFEFLKQDSIQSSETTAHSSKIVDTTPPLSRGDSTGGSESIETSVSQIIGANTPASAATRDNQNWTNPPSIWQLLLGCYVFVSLALACRMLTGIVALNRLRSSATILDADELVTSVFDSLKIKRQPDVRISRDVEIPMAFGILQPTVLLPTTFQDWDVESQRAVLIHEACHVQRFDALWELVSRFVSVAYWFHPVVYAANHFLRLTRERATDVMVLEHGISPTKYAKQLLDISTAIQKPREPAMFMACDGDIKNRIKSILDPRTHQPSHPKRSFAFKAVVAGTFLAIAGISIQFSFASPISFLPEDKESQETRPKVEITGNSFYERVKQIEPNTGFADWRFSESKITVSGKVTDDKGNPVKDAIVVLRDSSFTVVPGDGEVNDVIAKTRSDEEGFYQFENVSDPFSMRSGRFWDLIAVTEAGIGFCKRGMQKNSDNLYRDLDIQLKKLVDITGTVVSPNGKPLENAQIRISHFSEPVNGYNEQASFSDRLMNPRAQTKENGEFVLPGMPASVVVGIKATHLEYINVFQSVRTTKDHPEFIVQRGLERRRAKENGLQIKLKKGITVTGKIVDQEGRPRSGVQVSTWHAFSTSDDDGNFSMLIRDAAGPSDRKREVMTYTKSERFSSSTEVDLEKLKSGGLTICHPIPTKFVANVTTLHSAKPIQGVEVTFDVEDSSHMYAAISNADGFCERSLAGKLNLSLRSRNAQLRLDQAIIEGLDRISTDSDRESIPSQPGTSAAKIGRFDFGYGGTRKVNIRIPTRNAKIVTVRDANGDAIEGAEVGYCRNLGEGFKAEAVTDEEGIARFDSHTKEIGRSNNLFARHETDGKIYWAEARWPQEEYQLTLDPAIRVSGTISVEAKPLAGIAVNIRKANGNLPSQLITKAITDHRGRYSAMVPARDARGSQPTYRINLQPTDLIPNKAIEMSVRKAVGNADQLRADLSLVRGGQKISGTVVDVRGNPVANASVQVHSMLLRIPGKPMDEFQGWQLFGKSSCFSDESGRFEITQLPAGYLAILFAKSDSGLAGGTLMTQVGNDSATILVTDGSKTSVTAND